jgi:hypothetical protein
MQAGTASVKAGGEDSADVQNQQVAGAEQVGKISKFSVLKAACRAREVQQAGAAAVSKRFLRNQLFREIKVKVRNQHQLDYRTGGTKFRTSDLVIGTRPAVARN